ncbi:MAG: hypothetical protein WD004_08025 [Actinomycetota bacterium]
MEPMTTTAWGVRLDVSPQDFKGELTLEEEDLVFALAGEQLRIPLAEVRKVKRLRGSPVVVIERQEPEKVARYAFYFVKPPPMRLEGSSKRKARRRGAMYLSTANQKSADAVKVWGKAIQEAVEAARAQAETTEA